MIRVLKITNTHYTGTVVCSVRHQESLGNFVDIDSAKRFVSMAKLPNDENEFLIQRRTMNDWVTVEFIKTEENKT